MGAAPGRMVARGRDLFVANWYSASVTEIDTSTGKLVRVMSGRAYHFNFPDALIVRGEDLFVANSYDNDGSLTGNGNSLTEINAETGRVVRVISGLATTLTRRPRWCSAVTTCSWPTRTGLLSLK